MKKAVSVTVSHLDDVAGNCLRTWLLLHAEGSVLGIQFVQLSAPADLACAHVVKQCNSTALEL